jgi:hypothetical protein
VAAKGTLTSSSENILLSRYIAVAHGIVFVNFWCSGGIFTWLASWHLGRRISQRILSHKWLAES